MKILILYATRTNTSEKVAKYLAKQFNGNNSVDIVNIKDKRPNIQKYDKIIMGSGIYYRKIDKGLREYIQKNKDELLERKFAFYFCCAEKDIKRRKEIMDTNFSGVIASKAMGIVCAGGKLNPKEHTFLKRIMLRLFIKCKKFKDAKGVKIEYDELDKFMEIINSVSIDKNSRDYKINPVPPTDKIITAKEKLEHTKKPKDAGKAERLKPQPPSKEEKQVLKQKESESQKPKK